MKKGKGRNLGLLPNSLKIISSCLKTVSTNASTVASTVRSAGASVAGSISAAYSEDEKDQVTWAGFDILEVEPSVIRHVLLIGYLSGFQVLDVEDASNFKELVSKRGGPVSFLQMHPSPAKPDTPEKPDSHDLLRGSHPLLLIVAGEESKDIAVGQNHSPMGVHRSCANSHNAVQFYSLKSHSYVHVLRFRSAVCMVRCSAQIVAVGLSTQIYCFDAITLEIVFSVLTSPVPEISGQGTTGINVGYGPMAVGPRWLAYPAVGPLPSTTVPLSSQSLCLSRGVNPSSLPCSDRTNAHYAVKSGKQLAAGIVSLSDMGYKAWSKYCQDLNPNKSNLLIESNSGRKGGRHAGMEADCPGMVAVKDFITRAIITQFRAHTSPLSALCFDPSGTLLVTASIYGNNINIFRIIPNSHSGSSSRSFDFSSSHVHLYKLHRGITSAMIQDICFSNYSQWVAIVSSKGTCHVFLLSPFGGEAGFRILNSQGEEPCLLPVLSLPWWSTSSLSLNQQPFPPPPPVSLSVVSRIKYSSFGWLNTVNNSAGSGKGFVPSGAVAAIFHNTLSHNIQHVNSKPNSLEHLLVYTPSGHVVQHELLPSFGAEPSLHSSRTESSSFLHMQEDDLKLKVEPIQWWDACRRSDYSERGECIIESTFDGQDVAKTKTKTIQNGRTNTEATYDFDFQELNDGSSAQNVLRVRGQSGNEQSHWFLSNAELQISSGRLPIWQNSKIYVMTSPRISSMAGGEFEIEKVPVQEIEVTEKELLPCFDHCLSLKSDCNDRGLVLGRCSSPTSSETYQSVVKVTEEIVVICHSKPASLSSTESSDGGSSRRMENFIDFDQASCEKSCTPLCHHLNEMYWEKRASESCMAPKSPNILSTRVEGSRIDGSPCDLYFTNSDFDFPSTEQVSLNKVTFEHTCQEEPCKALEDNDDDDGCQDVNDVSTDQEPDRSSNIEYENVCSDENDKIFGDMVTSSEEG
ncbi:autophagy-related protein 18g isoform X3 [Cucurbita moschata]|uniref:Autophagy-related protein 18g isoform X2 n=1 Tax=Cucurbita moschata TaxID=3662 RepID=A0A6J1GS94_CUCMO|nr:autophagy-related protein 18g isoform X2 [Cucurbita moschata]XP_022954196.1 autophagy-related protein 18g isoform X3 [Cucurbita moschata]